MKKFSANKFAECYALVGYYNRILFDVRFSARIPIVEATVNPGFFHFAPSETRPNDLAILRLASPIPAEAFQSGFAEVAQLLQDGTNWEIQELKMVGWGASMYQPPKEFNPLGKDPKIIFGLVAVRKKFVAPRIFMVKNVEKGRRIPFGSDE